MPQQEEETCILCSEKAKIIGLGSCNHKHICHICTIKMRQKCKDISCPICKQKLEKIIFTDQLDSEFKDFNLGELIKDQDLFFDCEETKYVVEQLNQLKCFAPNCKEGSIHYTSLQNLKKHLKERHSRVLCEICLDYRTCVLNEQIIYSQYQLQKHQNQGDYDEDGNIIFFHPNCKYCSKLFYDEDKLKFHLNDAHINCSLCGTQHKYRYYKDHGAYERHLRLSHYMCDQPECRDSLAAFQSQAEFEAHQAKYHGGDFKGRKLVNQAAIQQFVGFYQQEETKSNQNLVKNDIFDKEGHNFEDQFISLLKTRLGGIVSIDDHKDELLEIRDFYQIDYNDKEDEYLDSQESIYGYEDNEDAGKINDSKIDKNQYRDKERDYKNGNERDEKNNQNSGNNKYRQKGHGSNQNEQNGRKQFDKNQQIYQEDIKIIKPNQMPNLFDDQLRKKIQKFIKKDQIKQFEDLHYNFLDGIIKPDKFIQQFLDMLGQRTGFRILNFYLTFKSLKDKKSIQRSLEESYIKAIKLIPRKIPNMVSLSNRYSDFFSLFMQHIEGSIKDRIKDKELNINKRKDITMDRERIFQLTEILRHLKTQEMGKLKFAVNFGLSIQSLQIIRSKIFTEDINSVKYLLHSIPNQEIIALYLYVSQCLRILKGEIVHQEKKDINKYVLHEFFVKNGDFIAQYKNESSESSEEEQASFPQQLSAIENKKKQGKVKKVADQAPVIVLSQYDFPTFPSKQEQKPQKQQKGGVWDNATPVVFLEKIDKNVKKQIAQEFPSLDNIQKAQQKSPQKINYKNSNAYEIDESFQPLPQQDQAVNKVQQKPSKDVSDWQEEAVDKIKDKQTEIGVINKKGKKKVMLAGGFK